MGAVLRFYLVSVVIPPNWEELDVLSVFDGLSQLAKKHQMDLIGGDTVSGDTFVLSVTVIGYADEEKVRYRSDAKVRSEERRVGKECKRRYVREEGEDREGQGR